MLSAIKMILKNIVLKKKMEAYIGENKNGGKFKKDSSLLHDKNNRDVIKAANRSKKKAKRQQLKKTINKLLNEYLNDK